MDSKKIDTLADIQKIEDLNVANVHRVYEFFTTDEDGNKLTSKSDPKKNLTVKVELCEKPVPEYPEVYMEIVKATQASHVVSKLIRQLKVVFFNKGLKPENPDYYRGVPVDFFRYKCPDGTNISKVLRKSQTDPKGKIEYATLWADPNNTDALIELLYMARATELMEPLMVRNKDGKNIFGIDLTKGIFPGMIPLMSEATKANLEKLMSQRMNGSTPKQTRPETHEER